MPGTLVDANVLLDVFTEDHEWLDWSASMLERAANDGALYINPIIYAEVSLGFSRIEDLDDALPPAFCRRAELPWPAAFLAAQAFARYRRGGGTRRSTLPAFYIGAFRRPVHTVFGPLRTHNGPISAGALCYAS